MAAGELYGKYQLLEPIASGGMAEVWLARSSSIGGFEKILAIKRMHASLCKNSDFVDLFIEEAKLSVSLNHPNIVQIFDFGRVDDNYYIAMEFVDGLDLASIAHEARDLDRRFPVDASVFVMRQAFDGLAYAHGRGGTRYAIIHRDVSPHNVLVSFEGQVKISDFGIAKAAKGFMVEGEGEVVGKVAYMSPEQARGEALTPATDVWAAGVMLYELLTNERLFAKDSEDETLEAVATQPILPPSDLSADIPDELNDLLLRILDREPSRRPQTITVAEHLGRILHQHYSSMNDLRLEQEIANLYDGEPPRIPLPDEAQPSPSRSARTTELTPTAASREEATQLGENTEHTVFEPTAPSEVREVDLDIQIEALKDQFSLNPNLWLLVDIGEVYERAGERERALGALALAAGKFAQRGLLVQAVAIACRLVELDGEAGDTAERTAQTLQSLVGARDEDVITSMLGTLPAELAEELEDVVTGASSPATAQGAIRPVPILSSIPTSQFVRLVYALERREMSPGEQIMTEGDPGDAFYWIGKGRVVVSARGYEGKRVYLTSLADGDCFGEQGFFSGEPRTATVEATEAGVLVQVKRSALDALVAESVHIQEGLREFYKERLAESLLARSPLFGQLSIRDRRRMAERFTFTHHETGAMILSEGDESDCFYAIKTGKVEVSKATEDAPMRIAVLEPGEVFGEIAALRGTKRNASVRALEPCELLRLESSELRRFLKQNQHVKEQLETQMNERIADTTRKLNVPT